MAEAFVEVLKYISSATKRATIRKAEDDELEKARSGIYKNNAENIKKQRVGQKYGVVAEEDERIIRIKQYLSEQTNEKLSELLKQKNNPEFLTFHIIQELKKRQDEKEREYTKIRTEASEIIQGHKRISRLPEQAESGRKAGGERNVQASCLIGRSQSANKTDTRKLKKTQEKTLEEWAKHEKIWFNHDNIKKNWERMDDGTSAEAEVYYFPKTKTVRKVFQYDALDSNYTPMGFIDDRISIHNALFPETKYTVLGFTRTSSRGFCFVIEQPFIDGEKLTVDELVTHMNSLGFPNQTGYVFWNDYYVVGDLHEKNVLKAKDDNGNIVIYFIDPEPRLNTSDDENGKSKYLPFKVLSK